MSYRRYEVLEAYVSIINIVAWVLLVVSVLGAFYLFGLGISGSGGLGVYVLVLGGIGTLGLLAYAQLITVVIDIQSNTQKSATDTSALLELLTRVHEVKSTSQPKTAKVVEGEIVRVAGEGQSFSPIQQALMELENEEKNKGSV